jgi:hypothetical protein
MWEVKKDTVHNLYRNQIMKCFLFVFSSLTAFNLLSKQFINLFDEPPQQGQSKKDSEFHKSKIKNKNPESHLI